MLNGTVIKGVGLGQSTVLPSMDFETYSEAGFILDPTTKKVRAAGSKGGLPLVGTAAYAEHPSTEILCLYYDLKDGLGRRPYIPGLTPDPLDLIDHVRQGRMIEAFNVTFEWYIWNLICVRRMGWPPLQLEQCVCVMSRARRFGMPGSLARLAGALGTEDKDAAGKRLINQLCRPVNPTKNRPAWRRTPTSDWDKFQALYRYCDQDVASEDAAAARLPDLTPYEREMWLTDQRINARGVQVDVETLDAAIDVLGQMAREYTKELAEITGGAVGSASEVAKILEYMRANGVYIPDMQAETVSAWLDEDEHPDLPPVARRVLEIRATLAGANVKKLPKLKAQLSSDGRLRNQYMYCGADQTGRWSSSAADENASNSQLQNITAKGPKYVVCANCGHTVGAKAPLNLGPLPGCCPECGGSTCVADKDGKPKQHGWDIDAVLYAVEDIRSRDLARVEDVWGDPSGVLAGCLRGLFVAKPGHDYICCDFSAIEAVILACLSRCQWRIDVFKTHGRIYEMSASKIAGIPFEEMMACKGYTDTTSPRWWEAKATGHDHPLRKTLGKVAELASGYGGWIGAWKAFGADKFMSEAEIKEAILAWRAASPEIVDFWGGQYVWCGPGKWDYRPQLFGLEGAAIAAIQNPGQCYHVHDISYGVHNDVLYCRLPSGRFIHYHAPRLHTDVDRLRRGPVQCITFMGNNSNSKKGPLGWQRLETYGGMLAENVTQAVAADVQGEGLIRLERNNYPVVMHTHDEAITEMLKGTGSVAEMSSIMSEPPAWASWWPLRAAGWRHERYQKD